MGDSNRTSSGASVHENRGLKLPCQFRFSEDDRDESVLRDERHDFTEVFPLSATIRSLDDVVRREILQRLSNDVVARDQTSDIDAVVQYDLDFDVHDRGLKVKHIKLARRQLLEIRDFFSDPKADGLKLTVNVKVSSQPSVRPAGQHPEGVKLISPFLTDTDRSFFCIGEHRPDELVASNAIPLVRALICDCEDVEGHENKAKDPRIRAVKAWDFGDYCIGDPTFRFQEHDFVDQTGTKSYGNGREEYCQPYDQAKSVEALHKLVSDESQAMGWKSGSKVPFMPTFTMNAFIAGTFGFGSIQKVTINAVVRFVSFVDAWYIQDAGEIESDDPGADEGESWLPKNVQMTFASDDGPNAVVSRLEAELMDTADNASLDDGRRRTFDQLFRCDQNRSLAAKTDSWQLSTWVLPQGGKRLHPFSTAPQCIARSLSEFLDPTRVDAGDCRLYLEAHIGKADLEGVVVADEAVMEEESSGE